jgi:hypothetical protein
VTLHTFTMGPMSWYLNGKGGPGMQSSRLAWGTISGVPLYHSQPHRLLTWYPGYSGFCRWERWSFR